MAKSRDQSGQAAAAAVKLFLRLPTPAKVGLVALVVVGVVVYLVVSNRSHTPATEQQPPPAADATPSWALPASGKVVFMFWNVENLFDDADDKRNSIDDPYDNWFATDAAARQLKYDHLSEVILKQNGGRGPDVLACVEVESVRAATLLRDALNAKLPADVPAYRFIGMKEVDGGRHIAPAVISRVPLDDARTTLHGRDLRILEVHVVSNGRALCVIASHWTSQLRQPDGSHGERGRLKYATTIYELVQKKTEADPDADVLVCGDFNDTPNSEPVTTGLHLTADRAAVVPARSQPKLLGLLSGKPPEQFGTHYYNGPLIYDHVGISAGMLDQKGWGCDPNSVAVFTDGLIRARSRTRNPWRFGSKNDDAAGRGYADHFPVVATLRVSP
ncbi:MAG: endonuclease/exonuclease/phosphatase family protein [Gemmataceae bacterium]|nr:endonuclease/exonuclease/phosphatase family protein [Gemmataceae bacterium]